MSDNPYESPREAGYQGPPSDNSPVMDRIVLLVCGVLVYLALMAAPYLWQLWGF